MSCENNFTVKLTTQSGENVAEYKPITANYRDERNKYNFCRASFSYHVGQDMEQYTEGGVLDQRLKAHISTSEDQELPPLLFRPDWAKFGTQRTDIQFRDLHYALEDGEIDYRTKVANLRDVYNHIFSQVRNNLIEDIKFQPDLERPTIEAGQRYGYEARENLQQKAMEDTTRLVDSKYAIDFEDISPQEAIEKLNKKFTVKSWVNKDLELVVGIPEASGDSHLSSRRDPRTWNFKDPSISHGREPIKTVLVKGGWVDEPGVGTLEDGIKAIAGFFPSSSEQGVADLRVIGIAQRQDVENGKSVVIEIPEAKKEAVESLAKLSLTEQMKQQNMGSIGLDPSVKGSSVEADPESISPGDLLRTVPEGRHWDNVSANTGKLGDLPPNPEKVCGSMVKNEAYLVSQVTHNLAESGDYQITVNIGLNPTFEEGNEPETGITYFNPEKQDYIKDNRMDKDGNLKNSGLFEIN